MIVPAYDAAFGREGLPNLEAEFLRQNFQQGVVKLALSPGSLHKLSSSWLGRAKLPQQKLDVLYQGKTFGDVESHPRHPRHPQLIVTATDLTRGNGFECTWDRFALICCDLSRLPLPLPLSFVVAASSAVPMALSALTGQNFLAACPEAMTEAVTRAADWRQRICRAQMNEDMDSAAQPHSHLVGGGLSDNLRVQRLLDCALMSSSLRQSVGGT